MALKITDQNGLFIIEGSINSVTSKHFENHLEEIINKNNKVTINIDKVNQIDSIGLSILKHFYNSCLRNYNKAFFIVGNGCKEIYDDFKIEESS